VTVQAEEKSTLPSSQPILAVADDQDEPFDNKEGWRIAREAFWRECVRWGGQGLIVMLLLAVIGYAGYWSLSEMKSLPAFIQAIARPFMPPPTQDPAALEAERAAARLAEEKEHHHQTSAKKHHHHSAPRQLAAKAPRRQPSTPGSDDPTGGRIIYSDGYNTEYRWDK